MSNKPTQALPSPPFYTIPNINNLRDASISLTTTSGSRIRPHTLFRSAEVSKLDLAGWTAVHSLGISHVFDLRSKPEVDKGWAGVVGKDASGDDDDDDDDVRPGWVQAMEQAGVAREWVPVFEERDYSPERLADRYAKYMDEAATGFVEAYRDILESGGRAFGSIMSHLAAISVSSSAEHDGGNRLGVLVHCTAGKDRTGLFFALLFDFLGVPREQIAGEYQLTELGLAHIREEVVTRLTQSPGFRKHMLASMEGTKLSVEDVARRLKGEEGQDQVQVPPEVLDKGRQAALRMIGARKETMLKSLEMLDREFGGAERYLREKCGLSDRELDALKRNLLVEGQAREAHVKNGSL